MNWTIIEQYDDWYTDRDGTEAMNVGRYTAPFLLAVPTL